MNTALYQNLIAATVIERRTVIRLVGIDGKAVEDVIRLREPGIFGATIIEFSDTNFRSN
jgi:hypothetical protein